MPVPIRTCVACRRSAGKRELIRLVVARGVVQVDPSASHPGRGAYLCALARCIDVALRRDGAAIRRALRVGQALPSGQALQHGREHVTLDVDGLRAQLGEVETPNAERSHARRENEEAALPARGRLPQAPRPARE
ncbi:MAG: YlxR family protein [Egibacteraceae bacterium]